MKIPNIILLLLSSITITAQSTNFIYQYTYISDTLKKNDHTKTYMVLSVCKSKSEFFSLEKYKIDSTLTSDAKKGIYGMPPPKGYINYRVIKNYSNKKTEQRYPLIGYTILIEDRRKLKWILKPEHSILLGYKIQKAETDFAGRHWIAWFTTEIPIQDGPYKFSGLPGLILKIEDTTKSHIFELKSIKKYQLCNPYPELDLHLKLKNVNEDDFRKIFKNYRNNPAASLIGRIPDQVDSEGNFRSAQSIIRTIEKHQKEKFKRDNNIIEIDLLR